MPFARPGAEFTRDFECLVAWLASKVDKTTLKRMLRIDWDTVGRIVKRVCDEELDPGRLDGLFEIGIDEVSWKRQHKYLTLVIDHLRRQVVWGDHHSAEGPGRVKHARLRTLSGAGNVPAVANGSRMARLCACCQARRLATGEDKLGLSLDRIPWGWSRVLTDIGYQIPGHLRSLHNPPT